MIEIRDLKIGDIIGMNLNGRFVAGEVTAVTIEEKPGSPMSDGRPGKVKVMFREEFREREYPDQGCEIYQVWVDDNPDKYWMTSREEALEKFKETASFDDHLLMIVKELEDEIEKLYLNYCPTDGLERIKKHLEETIKKRKNDW